MPSVPDPTEPRACEWCHQAALVNVLSRYSLHLDNGDKGALLDIFTDDASFCVPDMDGGIPHELVGRNSIVSALLARRAELRPLQRRHVTTNSAVTEMASDTAKAISYMLLFSSDGKGAQLITTGIYQDRLTLCGDGKWRIAERVVILDNSIQGNR
jgi:3-phenylpropionate/cinnamic acid dioxygenase small subunit